MEANSFSLESFAGRVEQFGKTSIELYGLKAIDKSAEVVSVFASKLIIIIYFSFVFLFLNAGVALWIGSLLGKWYLGFFTVAAFYGMIGLFFYVFRNKWIKIPVRNSIIIHALK